MPWLLYLSMQGSLAKGCTAKYASASETWKVSDNTKGLTRFPEGL